jgi:hypothetical protein
MAANFCLKIPGNIALSERHKRIFQDLISNEDIRRIAGFQSSGSTSGYASHPALTLRPGCFQWYAPKLFKDYDVHLSAFHENHPNLQRNFTNSIFPAATFNLGPHTVCIDHVDCHNRWNGWCAISAGGTYDPVFGGHLVLWDLKKIIQFPPGSTILLPSAALRHGNIPIRSHESRVSFTQYAAAGLFRWVKYGFRTGAALKIEDEEEMRRLDEESEQRWQDGLEMYSKAQELHDDRMRAWGPSQS